MRAFRLLYPSPSANGWRRRDRALVTALGIASAISIAPVPTMAQEPMGAVAGKVTAADVGTPLAGATVFVTGAQTGAYTRTDGTCRTRTTVHCTVDPTLLDGGDAFGCVA